MGPAANRYNGFKAFCKYFLEKYPGYFVSPLRISGSAVESLFSQYKHNTGGKLDSCNYTTARCAHLVQRCASNHHSGIGYRDQKLTSEKKLWKIVINISCIYTYIHSYTHADYNACMYTHS